MSNFNGGLPTQSVFESLRGPFLLAVLLTVVDAMSATTDMPPLPRSVNPRAVAPKYAVVRAVSAAPSKVFIPAATTTPTFVSISFAIFPASPPFPEERLVFVTGTQLSNYVFVLEYKYLPAGEWTALSSWSCSSQDQDMTAMLPTRYGQVAAFRSQNRICGGFQPMALGTPYQLSANQAKVRRLKNGVTQKLQALSRVNNVDWARWLNE